MLVVGVSEMAKRSAVAGAVMASLPFFLILPGLLDAGWTFCVSMGVAGAGGVVAYLVMNSCLTRLGEGV